jgi:hypothetical protein
MLSHDSCDLFDIGACPLGNVDFEKRFKDRELLDDCFPLLLWNGRQVGQGSGVPVPSRIIGQHLIDWDPLESALAYFTRNNRVEPGTVRDYETSLAPSKSFPWSERN